MSFVPAGSLRTGERLRTRTGATTIEQIRPMPGLHEVFNLEIGIVHEYYVSAADVLVHNTYGNAGGGGGGEQPEQGVGPSDNAAENTGISMDQAVDQAADHVDGQGVMEETGKGTNYQFRNTSVDGNGDTVTKIGRFDVNPADPHVAANGPHLNLETQVNGEVISNDHIPIDPTTVRPGDHP